MTKPLAVREETYDKIRKIARRSGITMVELVAEMVEVYELAMWKAWRKAGLLDEKSLKEGKVCFTQQGWKKVFQLWLNGDLSSHLRELMKKMLKEN